jgi:hypothetical protein
MPVYQPPRLANCPTRWRSGPPFARTGNTGRRSPVLNATLGAADTGTKRRRPAQSRRRPSSSSARPASAATFTILLRPAPPGHAGGRPMVVHTTIPTPGRDDIVGDRRSRRKTGATHRQQGGSVRCLKNSGTLGPDTSNPKGLRSVPLKFRQSPFAAQKVAGHLGGTLQILRGCQVSRYFLGRLDICLKICRTLGRLPFARSI